jgi:hypothetical protein
MNALLRQYDNWTFMQNQVQFSTDVNSCTLEMICFVPSTKHCEIPQGRGSSKVGFCSGPVLA